MTGNTSQASAHAERAPYTTPELTLFGSVKDLTASGSTPTGEDKGVGGGNRRFG